MKRDDVLRVLRDEVEIINAIPVTTMQAIPAWYRLFGPTAAHLYAEGCMGSASALGLGLALAASNRKIIVIDGDGSLLMQLGSLSTIAHHRPKNLYHFVLANGKYETSGNQDLPRAPECPLDRLANAAGYAKTYSFDHVANFKRDLVEVLCEPGPIFINLVVDSEQPAKSWPSVSLAESARSLRLSLVTSVR